MAFCPMRPFWLERAIGHIDADVHACMNIGTCVDMHLHQQPFWHSSSMISLHQRRVPATWHTSYTQYHVYSNGDAHTNQCACLHTCLYTQVYSRIEYDVYISLSRCTWTRPVDPSIEPKLRHTRTNVDNKFTYMSMDMPPGPFLVLGEARLWSWHQYLTEKRKKKCGLILAGMASCSRIG